MNLKVCALSAGSNIKLLEEQIREFKPEIAAVYNEQNALDLKQRVSDLTVKILSGMDGLCEVSAHKDADLSVISVVGMVGLLPTVSAIKAKKDIALANKETLVTAGEIINKLVKENGVKILPVDSEHSAVFQCLNASYNKKREIKRIILTASGGPFFGKTKAELEKITPEMALKHPNWDMGAKITIDSATMMNKGLEFIEAYWLFNVGTEQIDVVIHRESIIHSMVEFCDNSIIAQLGVPNMTIPIQYAVTYPDRFPSPAQQLDIVKVGSFTFHEPDNEVFPLLNVCKKAISIGGTMPAAVNAANEEAVKLFLNGKISFAQISKTVSDILLSHKVTYNPEIKDILNTEKEVRNQVARL